MKNLLDAPIDASMEVEGTSLKEDIRGVEDNIVWRVKVRWLHDNSRRWVPYNQNMLVRAFFCLDEASMEMSIQDTQIMRCVNCHSLPIATSTSSTHTGNNRNKKGKLTLFHMVFKKCFVGEFIFGFFLWACGYECVCKQALGALALIEKVGVLNAFF